MQVSLCHLGRTTINLRRTQSGAYQLNVAVEGGTDFTLILSEAAWAELFTQYQACLLREAHVQMELADANG